MLSLGLMRWILKLMTPMRSMRILSLSLDLQPSMFDLLSLSYNNKHSFFCSKDNPLEFTFWRKMLRDVREQLKADALAKLKESCPTLFSMGWFKENLPKSDEELQIEDDAFSLEDKQH